MTIPKSYEALAADLASEKIISKTLLGQKEAYMKLADKGGLDLSESKSREAALREELTRYQSLFAQAQKAIDRLNELHPKRMGELAKRLTVAEQNLGDAYEWGYGDGQQSPNGYSDKEDRDKCVAELLKQAADCEHGYSNQTGCPVCQGIKP